MYICDIAISGVGLHTRCVPVLHFTRVAHDFRNRSHLNTLKPAAFSYVLSDKLIYVGSPAAVQLDIPQNSSPRPSRGASPSPPDIRGYNRHQPTCSFFTFDRTSRCRVLWFRLKLCSLITYSNFNISDSTTSQSIRTRTAYKWRVMWHAWLASSCVCYMALYSSTSLRAKYANKLVAKQFMYRAEVPSYRPARQALACGHHVPTRLRFVCRCDAFLKSSCTNPCNHRYNIARLTNKPFSLIRKWNNIHSCIHFI